MSAIEVITNARVDLETAMIDAVCIVRAMDSIDPNNPPDWLAVFFGRILDLESKLNLYMDAVHQHAYPLLRDIQAVNSKGGVKLA